MYTGEYDMRQLADKPSPTQIHRYSRSGGRGRGEERKRVEGSLFVVAR